MMGYIPVRKPTNQDQIMKFLLTALFVASVSTSLTFAEEGDCKDKCKDKEKKESTLVAEADGDCKDKCKDKKKEEGTFLAAADGEDCKDKCKDKKKEEGTLA